MDGFPVRVKIMCLFSYVCQFHDLFGAFGRSAEIISWIYHISMGCHFHLFIIRLFNPFPIGTLNTCQDWGGFNNTRPTIYPFMPGDSLDRCCLDL